MRRIYESSALKRDDEEAFAPRERDGNDRPQAMRSVPSGFLSRVLIPYWLRYRSVSISVETPKSEFPAGSAVPFRVTMKNALPAPVTLPVRSPVLWTWSVDDAVEGSRVPLHDPPDEPRGFRFDRGERKVFSKRWNGLFKVTDSEWEPAEPGEYTIGAGINVDDAAGKGLYSETTVRLTPD